MSDRDLSDRYERIRAALAKGPTPGEWYWSDAYPTQDGRKTWSLIGDGGFGILSCDGDENSPQSVNTAAAELIAACDPDTIRALLAERDQLVAALAAAQQRIACLPADWREDSSLETWFPFTAEEIKRLRARIAELEKAAKAVCAYDWSDNDEDAVRAVEKLRTALGN